MMKRNIWILVAILLISFCACGEKRAAAVSENKSSEEKEVQAALEEKAEQPKEAKAVSENAGETETQKNVEAQQEKAIQEEKAVQEETEVQADSGVQEGSEEQEEEPKLSEYTVTVWEETMVMYAFNPVNVRKGPTTDFERIGSLGRGEEVTVTGQADTDWYEIIYGEEKGYVSDHYLQKEKPTEEPLPEQTGAEPQNAAADQAAADAGQVQAVTEVKNVSGVIMVGDSRFVQMQANVGENSCTWIAENGKGYNWLNETAVARIDGCVGKGSKVLINLGVNDPENLKNYLELVNAKAAEWVSKGATVYYASVNPVWTNPYVTEEEVEYFNSQLQGGLSADIHWIDSHSYLDSIGYKLVDGLHYNAQTYQNLYAYFMSCLG